MYACVPLAVLFIACQALGPPIPSSALARALFDTYCGEMAVSKQCQEQLTKQFTAMVSIRERKGDVTIVHSAVRDP